MSDFSDSTLWRLSAFERLQAAGGGAADGRPTLLPTTLMADLRRLGAAPAGSDVLEVVAACLRHREPALLHLGYGRLVWPVTVFPAQQLYHSPRAVTDLGPAVELAGLKLLDAQRPGVRPPGHVQHDRVAAADRYRALNPLLWTLALHGPRRTLLAEIDGRAAYRLASGALADQPALPGALGPAAERLRARAASVREMAGWPGMSVERASRLLNGLYLTGGLMVMRSHAAAREAPDFWRQWFGRRR